MEFKFKDKVTVSEITKFSKQQAEDNSLRMNNPVVVPVYIAIDLDETGTIGTITSPNLNTFFNKEIVKPKQSYTEKEYIIFKAFQSGMISGKSVDQVLGKYETFKDWFNGEEISEQALYEMKERFEKEHELEQYKVKGYTDDLGKY